ncbi:hypothetical protein CQ395_08830 [Clostridium neonatale]|uniref:Uncharacterized protein n=1 Tax=Clostridium neonatale TaxID=137838 RepID=A0A2A7MCH0_9CLOT|nr:hypothetical protein [Clostridium neonatale]PEG27095.1 hypothetical protein CQ395_08830 [Clostridium neonatale]PEG29237.1 hypothetical protein CQ394_17865 [Clostridium neonatale]CAH0435487.1 Conserved hypothetical protein [Clostridium neonatale]
MDTILAKYELIVYSSGKIRLNPLENSSTEELLSKCSSRIQQILATITTIKILLTNNPNASDIDIYSKALKEVSEKLEVNVTTISDKFTRQLKLNAEEARSMIFDYLRFNSSELKNILLKNVGKNTKELDTIAINSILK